MVFCCKGATRYVGPMLISDAISLFPRVAFNAPKTSPCHSIGTGTSLSSLLSAACNKDGDDDFMADVVNGIRGAKAKLLDAESSE